MVMSDDAIELVLQKWAWAKGEEAAMKLVVVSDLHGSRVFQNWHVGPMSFTMLGEMQSKFRKTARSWRIPCVASAKLPSSPICSKQEQTHIASLRRLRCPQVHIERLCMVISTKCQDLRSENCWGRKPLKCARLKWRFGSSSLGSSVVTEAWFFLVLAGLVEVLASQLLHMYCQKSEQASMIFCYGFIYFRLLLMIFCQQLPITAVRNQRIVL